MTVPLVVPSDEGHQKTRPSFLFPVQKSERSPAESVDQCVFGQVVGIPGRQGMGLKLLSRRDAGKQDPSVWTALSSFLPGP